MMENRGVSPVTGIILMVIIIVILSALIAIIVFGMADSAGYIQPVKSCECTVPNESVLSAVWIDGYHAGLFRAAVGNDTGWSWNYTAPSMIQSRDGEKVTENEGGNV